MADYTFQSVQFYIPKAAANAIDFAVIRQRARVAGLSHANFEYSEVKTGPGRGRITCRRELVPLFVDALAVAAGASEGQLVLDCAAAAKSALDALDDRGEGHS